MENFGLVGSSFAYTVVTGKKEVEIQFLISNFVIKATEKVQHGPQLFAVDFLSAYLVDYQAHLLWRGVGVRLG